MTININRKKIMPFKKLKLNKMKFAGLEEAQAGIKIARRNINNLRCADDTTLLWQKVKKN